MREAKVSPGPSDPGYLLGALLPIRDMLKRLKCAKSGHTRTAWRTGQIDPLLPSKIGPANGMEAPESGLRLKASVAPRPVVR